MTLKDVFKNSKKEVIYEFYVRILNGKAKDYEKVTRLNIYDDVVGHYQDDPEIILRLLSIEEILVLKKLIDEEEIIQKKGYIDYLIINNLKTNFLIYETEEGKYRIYQDLINYVKMALNLFNQEEYSLKDIMDSIIIGFLRACNVILLTDFIELLVSYNNVFKNINVKEYINSNPRLKDKLIVKRYKGKNYVVSLENYFYKDVLKLRISEYKVSRYDLEGLISLGKYKINLFKEPVFKFLNFLELHLEPKYIDEIIKEMIIYAGLRLDDKDILMVIANNIEPLFKSLDEVANHLPFWL